MKIAKSMVLVGILGAAMGCSSTDDFVGSWKFTSGAMILTCDGQTDTSAVTGNVTINEGSTSDLVIVDDQCSIKLKVDGETATLDGAQSCTGNAGGVTITLNYSTYTFTTSNGETGRLSAAGTATSSQGGLAITCQVNVTGDLEKL